MKRNILFLLSLCMLLLTCSDGNDPIKEIEKPKEENPFITLKKANIDFTNEGGSEAISIESNVTWTAKSSASWCTVSPSSGSKSTASITLTAPANKDYDNRSCTVTIESGNITKTITVNQGENLGLLVTQDRYELSNEESTIKVEVKANVEFEVKINDAWITKIETRGLTTSEMEFKIAKNDTYDNRDGSITIKQKDGDMVSTITIFQSQEDALILSAKDFDLSNEAQSIDVEVKTNIDYEIIIPEDAKDWVSHTTTRALRTETVMLDIAENKDYTERTTKITIKDKKTNLQETVTIKQATSTGLIVSEDKYELSNDGGSFNVEVKANVDYKVTINDSWITQIKTRGLTTTNLSFEVTKNESYSNREGTITISQTGGDLSSTITVYQSQENAIILSEKESEVSDRSQTLDVVIKTNIDFDVTIQEEGKDWVSYTPTRGLREETISFNILENKTDRTRSTEVYIKDKQTNLEETLTITQMGKEPGVYYVERMGTLSSMLSQAQKDTITTMIVKGEINKADFDVMKKYMPKLRYIDLKDVKCEGDKIPTEAFGGYYPNNKVINTIILPESITAIGESAFRGCTGLTGNLILPDGVTTIEDDAFHSCSGLTGNLILPDGVTIIEGSTFDGCTGFTGNLIIPNGVTKIESSAFSGCSGFTGNLILPDGLTTIGEWAFNRCSGFTGTLKLPNELTSIGRSAFQLCTGFTGNLIIPDEVTSIGDHAFLGCSGFTGNLIIPDGVTTIKEYTFANCIGLTGDLIIPDGVTTIEAAAFQSCSGFTGNLIIPDGVTAIGEWVFLGCSGFTGNLIIPDGVTAIGEWAFRECVGFTGDLIIPGSVKTIGREAFSGCSGFTGDLIIPGNVKTIGVQAFFRCSGLTGDLIISDGVTTIGNGAFSQASYFTGNLILPDGLTTIGNNAFTNCSGFTGNLILPDGVTTIGVAAFYNCFGFTGLTIGKNVTTIHQSAFYGCRNITGNVVFPKSLASTRNESFDGCNKVNAFQFPHTSPLGYYSNMLPSGATVKVPTSAVATYKATNGWKDHTIVGY